ncbi:hypothetical protein Tco_0153312 [Tanacetum coccineum]
MYCSIVSAIAFASSSSEYTWSESRLKSGDLNLSRLRVLKCLLDDRNSHSASVLDDRYTVSNGSGYAVLICWDEYAVLDRKLDTPYLIEVDTTVWRRIQELDMAYWGFFGVGTTLDVFQNIILIPYLAYGVLSPLDTAY